MTPAERARRYRDRRRGGPPAEPQPCGTHAAYVRHIRNEEEPCDACKRAHADYRAGRQGQ